MSKIRDVRGIGPAHKAALVYGQDEGMVAEFADAVIRRLPNPARTRISAADIKDSPAKFFDAASSKSLFGGDPCLYVTDAGNELTKTLAEYIDGGSRAAFVVVTAGPLGPDSSLRKLFEQSAAAASLPCYNDEDEGLKGLIASVLRGHGKFPDPDALEYLSLNLGSDRLVTRSELDKLAAYMGDEKRVTAEDAEAVVGDSGLASKDAVTYAAFGGDAVSAIRAFDRIAAEGEEGGVTRAMLAHWSKLMLVVEKMEAGMPQTDAMNCLRPKIMWKFEAEFRRQSKMWNREKLIWALRFLLDTEYLSKSDTSIPQEALLGRAVMRLAQKAKQA